MHTGTTMSTSVHAPQIAFGGFESGSISWTVNGSRIGTFSTEPACEGTSCAWLCGKGVATTNLLYQTVSIPAAATSATLSFAMHIDTAERSTWLQYDKCSVQVRNSAGTSVLATLATYSNLNKGTGYTQTSFDLSAYKGQIIQIYFKGTEDSSYQTSFVFDRVSLLWQ